MLKTTPEHLILEDISEVEDKPLFRVFESVQIEYHTKTRYISVVVPKGFTTDFGTIPKILRGVISNIDVFNSCYLLHDYFYDISCTIKIARSEADTILRKTLQNKGMSDWKAWAIYFGVKFLGGPHFKSKKVVIL